MTPRAASRTAWAREDAALASGFEWGEPASAAAEAFLRDGSRFRLGHLVTEQSHPVTRDLSGAFARDPEEGLRLLLRVDREIAPVFRRVAGDGTLESAVVAVAGTLDTGGRIFFSGCGATGRLSLFLESSWRGFWRRLDRERPGLAARARAALPATADDRVAGAMAGGDFALIRSVEHFEDEEAFGREQVRQLGVGPGDCLFAVTEGGETTHVIGAAWEALERGARVFFVYNNPDEALAGIERSARILREPRIGKIRLTTGPQAVTGSTRMQAASSETLVLGSVLECALGRVLSRTLDRKALRALGFSPPQGDLGRAARAAAAIPRWVEGAIPALARLVRLEAATYRGGGNFDAPTDRRPDRGFAVYLAGEDSALVILTDTTERSPTFCLPPFRPADRPEMKAPPASMVLEAPSNDEAWRRLLKREIRAIEWREADYRRLLGDAGLARFRAGIPAISRDDLLRIRIGGEGAFDERRLSAGNLLVAVGMESDLEAMTRPGSMVRTAFDRARKRGARRAWIAVSSRTLSPRRLPGHDDAALVSRVPRSPLDLPQALVLKLLLNSLSTGVFVSLGRVRGNWMTYVVPSNGKLVDRSARITAALTGIDYEAAVRLVVSTAEETATDLRAGRGLPPTVNLAVVRATLGVGTAKAVELLAREEGLLEPTLRKARRFGARAALLVARAIAAAPPAARARLRAELARAVPPGARDPGFEGDEAAFAAALERRPEAAPRLLARLDALGVCASRPVRSKAPTSDGRGARSVRRARGPRGVRSRRRRA